MTVTATLAENWINGDSEVSRGPQHAVIDTANQEIVAELALAAPLRTAAPC